MRLLRDVFACGRDVGRWQGDYFWDWDREQRGEELYVFWCWWWIGEEKRFGGYEEGVDGCGGGLGE